MEQRLGFLSSIPRRRAGVTPGSRPVRPILLAENMADKPAQLEAAPMPGRLPAATV